jgi:cyclopropane fatty-acyl-phospholipid synthase-like methyltransferase
VQRLAEIRAALSAHGIRPSKRMGQNFLVDTNMLHAIARDADVDAGDCVLEIGPGSAGLTQALADEAGLVVAAWLAREQAKGFEARFLLEPICEEGRLPSMATASEYLAMFKAAGFSDPEFSDLSRNVRKTWSVCAYRLIKTIGSNAELRRALLRRNWGNRVFAKTVFRIWLAYRTGSMRYGVFSATK